MSNDYLTSFIVNASKVTFTTTDGRVWKMRQPAPEEAGDGDSAYRLAYNRIINDPRLKDLAGSEDALKKEAHIRGSAAEAVYMLPLLLENENGEKPFDVFNETSLKAFEELPAEVVVEMSRVYWEFLQQAIAEAKKK